MAARLTWIADRGLRRLISASGKEFNAIGEPDKGSSLLFGAIRRGFHQVKAEFHADLAPIEALSREPIPAVLDKHDPRRLPAVAADNIGNWHHEIAH
jgi:hypothetical protein